MKKRLIYYLMTAIMACSFVTSSRVVFAVDSFYSGNDVLFYDPTDTGCISSSSRANTLPGSNINQEITAKFLTSTSFVGNGDKPMNAVQMAAIMGNIQQESSFDPNAGEGQSYRGIIQWNSPGRWDNIANPKTDLTNQLNFLKTELDGAYKDKLAEFWSASAPGDLDKATYAITRNYEVAINTGKENSSTIWTNSTDATDNLQDWVKREGYARSFYDTFGNLAGSGYVPGSDCGSLVSGGMTLDKAVAFMKEYRGLRPQTWTLGTWGTEYSIFAATCSGGPLANCVAFSEYFVNRYTDKQYVHTSNGDGVVKDLLAMGFKAGGHTPKVYSVFSATYGHTGVVLGIDKTNNKIIIGEASCGYSMDEIHAKEYDLKAFTSNTYTYAYTDGLLKGVNL